MKYPQTFIDMMSTLTMSGTKPNFLIGQGNPDSSILFVGKEPSNPVSYGSLEMWSEYIKSEKTPCYINKDPNILKHPQHMWRNYQRLYECIKHDGEPNKRPSQLDFEQGVFTTEMSQLASRKTALAQKKDGFSNEVECRKILLKNPYFDKFDVIVLACGHYISLQEIEESFHVKDNKKLIHYGKVNWFSVYSSKYRIVIHTRNLSSGVSTLMLKEIGKTIRDFRSKRNI